MLSMARLFTGCLLAVAAILIATDYGDWAARVGSLVVATSLFSAFLRTQFETHNPKDGPIIIDGNGYDDPEVLRAENDTYRKAMVGLRWEFIGAILGTLVNGFGGWAGSSIAEVLK